MFYSPSKKTPFTLIVNRVFLIVHVLFYNLIHLGSHLFCHMLRCGQDPDAHFSIPEADQYLVSFLHIGAGPGDFIIYKYSLLTACIVCQCPSFNNSRILQVFIYPH